MVNDSNGQILIVPCRMDGESSEAAKTRRTKRVKKKVVAAPEPLYRSTASIKLEENEKTIKSFQNLNGKLAEELYHSRTSANTELISLREHLSRVEGELKSETERASSAIDRLASETQESQRRSRELERRTEGLQAELADERSLRNAAQAECASLAQQVAQLQEQQRTAERRMERDTEHLTGIREQVHKYEAMAAGEASKAQEQGARNASLQRSLQDKERSWEELQKKHASLEGVVRSLTERNSLLVDAHRILEAEVAGGREAHGLAVQKASEESEMWSEVLGSEGSRCTGKDYVGEAAKLFDEMRRFRGCWSSPPRRLDGMQQQLQEQSQRAHLALEASNSAQGSLQEKSEGMSKMGAELEATRKERQVAGEHLEHERARAQQLEQEVGCLRVELDVSRRELAILAQQFE
eukprot:gene26364-32336_t